MHVGTPAEANELAITMPVFHSFLNNFYFVGWEFLVQHGELNHPNTSFCLQSEVRPIRPSAMWLDRDGPKDWSGQCISPTYLSRNNQLLGTVTFLSQCGVTHVSGRRKSVLLGPASPFHVAQINSTEPRYCRPDEPDERTESEQLDYSSFTWSPPIEKKLTIQVLHLLKQEIDHRHCQP